MSPQTAAKLQEDAPDQIPGEPTLVAVPSARPVPDLAPIVRGRHSPDHVERSESLRRRLLVGADVGATAAAMLGVLTGFALDQSALVLVAILPATVLLLKIGGLYNLDELRLDHTTLDEVPSLLQLTGLLALATVILHPLFGGGSLSRGRIPALWAASFAAVFCGRLMVRTAARRILHDERCLIIGEAGQAERLRQRIAASHATTRVVESLTGADIDRLGGAEIIAGLVRDLGIHRIIVAPLANGSYDVVELVRTAKAVGVRITVLPQILAAAGPGVIFDQVEGIPMLGVPHLGLCRTSRVLKRAVDVVATSIGLVFLAPLLIVIAAAIRLDSKGPIFFKQIRVGRGGQPFYIAKFRSMTTDAETRKEGLRALSVAGEGLFKIVDDPRVTRVGSFLRRTSLDELPQLFNVLRGEMSLVGPRPLVTDEDAQVLGLDRSRLRVKPGMTGPWQTLGSRVPLQEMVTIDYLYASHWSLWVDCKILLRTIQHVMRRGNL